MNQPARYESDTNSETAHLVIRATRSWVRAIMSDACSKARCWHLHIWDDSFDMVGSREAPHIWSSFMRLLSLEGNAKFQLGCGSCGRASVDEQVLLHCLASHQQGRKPEAMALLGRWFSGAALWRADALIEAFADQLSLKGFHLPYDTNMLPALELSVYDSFPTHMPN